MKAGMVSASAVLLAALACQGCGDSTTKPSGPAPASQASSPPSPAPPPSAPAAPVSQSASTPPAPAPTLAAPTNAPEVENREVAEAGVGEKGRGYGGAGFVTTPIEAKFRVEQRIVFEIQIPEAMKLFKANDKNNKGPKSDAEFQRKIIEANSIKLPELPAGDSYIYDPATEQLMVRHPKK